MKPKLRWLSIPILLLSVVACNRGNVELVGIDTSHGGGPDVAANETVIGVDAADDEPTIAIANWEQAQQHVGRHPGKVVILDLWARW